MACLLALAFFPGCGREDHQNIYRAQQELHLDILEPLPGLGYVNPAFRKYVTRFEKESGHKIMDRIIIDFGDTGDGEAAHCLPSNFSNIGVARVTVSKNYWRKYFQDYERELIVFHELGHCVLGRDHDEDWGDIVAFNLNSQTCAPLSIMYPSADWVLLSTYESHRDYYVHELVGKAVDADSFDIVNDGCSNWLKDAEQLQRSFKF